MIWIFSVAVSQTHGEAVFALAFPAVVGEFFFDREAHLCFALITKSINVGSRDDQRDACPKRERARVGHTRVKSDSFGLDQFHYHVCPWTAVTRNSEDWMERRCIRFVFRRQGWIGI